MRKLLIALAACAVTASTAAPAGAAPGLSTGFTDTAAFDKGGDDRPLFLSRARDANASRIRLFAFWINIVSREPVSREQAQDPGWDGYRFADLDRKLRDTAASGLDPVLVVTAAPRWAEGPGRPEVTPDAPAASWRPSPEKLADFLTAISRRYSGSTPDPLAAGAPLPRVRYWQVWNEPNLFNFLTPQWERSGGRLVPASARWYRGMLRAAYPALKAVSSRNVVVTAGLGPFGDLARGSGRIPPALWMRDFVCVTGRKRPKARRCVDGPARFDILAHHPYPIGPPRRHAPNPDDVVVADLDRLTRPLAVARRAGNVVPRRSTRLWATELSWDSAPDPDGLPLDLQARYLAGAFDVLRRQGVDTVLWFNLRDEPKGVDWGASLQSGIFTRGDTAQADQRKPSFTAFRFPFTAYIARRGPGTRVWGLAPRRGAVTIERRSGAGWRRAGRMRAGSSRAFLGKVRARRGEQLRARQGGEASLPWTVVR